jgi:hypothetical protein
MLTKGLARFTGLVVPLPALFASTIVAVSAPDGSTKSEKLMKPSIRLSRAVIAPSM